MLNRRGFPLAVAAAALALLAVAARAQNLYVPSGRVGIGNSSPQAKLDVTGNIIASTPTASNHVATKGYVDGLSTGPGTWSCTVRSASADNQAVTVSCSGNEKLINGSCKYITGAVYAGYPALWSGQSFNCQPYGTSTTTAYANCCQ